MMKRILCMLFAMLGSACSQPSNLPPGSSAMPDMTAAPPDLRPIIDITAPSFAGIQSATTAGMTGITLNWAAAYDAVTPSAQITYLVYQAAIANGEQLLTPSYTTSPGATTFSVTGLQPNTRYYFIVRARDLADNTDGNLTERSTTTAPPPDIQAPTFGGIAAAAPSGNSILLTWAAAVDDRTQAAEIGYLIYQSKTSGGQSFTQATYTPVPGATQYMITGLDARTTYYFVVRARDLSANGETNVVERSALTGDISYLGQVWPILNACAGCHKGIKPGGGLVLVDAATAYLSLVNQLSTQCTANLLVKPGQPDQSYLVWKLQGVGSCFTGTVMPPGGPLGAGDQNTVRGWIQAGALDN